MPQNQPTTFSIHSRFLHDQGMERLPVVPVCIPLKVPVSLWCPVSGLRIIRMYSEYYFQEHCRWWRRRRSIISIIMTIFGYLPTAWICHQTQQSFRCWGTLLVKLVLIISMHLDEPSACIPTCLNLVSHCYSLFVSIWIPPVFRILFFITGVTHCRLSSWMAATFILTMSGVIKSEEFLLDVQQKMNGKIGCWWDLQCEKAKEMTV